MVEITLEKVKKVYKPSFENVTTTIALVSGIFLAMKLISNLTAFPTGDIYGLPVPIEIETTKGVEIPGETAAITSTLKMNPIGALIDSIFWYLISCPLLAREDLLEVISNE